MTSLDDDLRYKEYIEEMYEEEREESNSDGQYILCDFIDIYRNISVDRDNLCSYYADNNLCLSMD